jgi:ATP-dependent RNA helicase DDX24/MAK5
MLKTSFPSRSFEVSSFLRDDQIEAEFDGNMGDEDGEEHGASETMQTFVFSATLSKDLQHNLKRRSRSSKREQKPSSTLGKFLS